jgi:16S rRNA (cytosine967-C5)-methyltransferase
MKGGRWLAQRALTALARGRSERLAEALDAAADGGDGVDAREMAFASELAHGVLRHERLLDHVIAGVATKGLPEDQALLATLRLGVQQLLFVTGVPARAAVHATVAIAPGSRGRGGQAFVNAVLRSVARRIEARPAAAARVAEERVAGELALPEGRTLVLPAPLPADPVARLAIVHTVPDFLAVGWARRFGIEGLAQIAEAASQAPDVFLRASEPGDATRLAAELAVVGVHTQCISLRCLRWTGGASPFATKAFAEGRFVVQDPTAQLAADAVPCGPGDTVVDLCAAPGTKTTRLAEKVRPGGVVFAFDADASRRARIEDNVARLALGSVVRVVEQAASLPRARAVLADVPCSNTGVLGRRVEVRRRLEPGTAAAMAAVQRPLLEQAMGLTLPGGAAVYSTCSIEHEENEGVVDAVLAGPAGVDFVRERQQLTLPRAGAGDGGFFAVLLRRG